MRTSPAALVDSIIQKGTYGGAEVIDLSHAVGEVATSEELGAVNKLIQAVNDKRVVYSGVGSDLFLQNELTKITLRQRPSSKFAETTGGVVASPYLLFADPLGNSSPAAKAAGVGAALLLSPLTLPAGLIAGAISTLRNL